LARFTAGFHLYGIPIRVHPSWLLTVAAALFGVVTLSPLGAVGVHTPTLYLGGAFVAAALFGSVLLHELAHATLARRYDLPVRRITMYFFGGAAEVDAAALRPRAEAIVAGGGPLASAGLAGLFGLLWLASRDLGAILPFCLQLLALANLALAILTILPGYPLDGGRIVRAGFWYFLDDLVAATRLAALYGQALAWAAMLAGALLLLRDRPFWAVTLICGGWFLRDEARSGYRQILWRDRSKRTPTIHAAFLQAPRIPADRVLNEAVDDVLEGLGRQGEGGPSLVVDGEGRTLGLLGLDQVRAVKRARWSTATAAEAMLPRADLPAIAPDVPLDATLATLAAGQYPYALVVSADPSRGRGDTAIGIITPDRIARHLARGGGTGRDKVEPVTEVGPAE